MATLAMPTLLPSIEEHDGMSPLSTSAGLDPEFDRALRATIQEGLRHLVEGAKDTRDTKLKLHGPDAAAKAEINQRYDEEMKSVVRLAEEQYRQIVARIKEERDWTEGAPAPASLVEEQQSILDAIKRRQGGQPRRPSSPRPRSSSDASSMSESQRGEQSARASRLDDGDRPLDRSRSSASRQPATPSGSIRAQPMSGISAYFSGSIHGSDADVPELGREGVSRRPSKASLTGREIWIPPNTPEEAKSTSRAFAYASSDPPVVPPSARRDSVASSGGRLSRSGSVQSNVVQIDPDMRGRDVPEEPWPPSARAREKQREAQPARPRLPADTNSRRNDDRPQAAPSPGWSQFPSEGQFPFSAHTSSIVDYSVSPTERRGIPIKGPSRASSAHRGSPESVRQPPSKAASKNSWPYDSSPASAGLYGPQSLQSNLVIGASRTLASKRSFPADDDGRSSQASPITRMWHGPKGRRDSAGSHSLRSQRSRQDMFIRQGIDGSALSPLPSDESVGGMDGFISDWDDAEYGLEAFERREEFLTLDRRNEELRHREEEVRQKEADVRRKEDDARKKEEDAREKEAEARRREEDARTREQRVRQREDQVRKLENDARQLEATVMQREDDVRKKEDEARRRERDGKIREEVAKHKEEEARLKADEVRKREEEVKRMAEEVEQRGEALHVVETELVQREEEVGRKESDIRRREEELKTKELQLRLLEEQLNDREATIRMREEQERAQLGESQRLRAEQRRKEEESRRAEEARPTEHTPAEQRVPREHEDAQEVRRPAEERRLAEETKQRGDDRRRQTQQREEARRQEEQRLEQSRRREAAQRQAVEAEARRRADATQRESVEPPNGVQRELPPDDHLDFDESNIDPDVIREQEVLLRRFARDRNNSLSSDSSPHSTSFASASHSSAPRSIPGRSGSTTSGSSADRSSTTSSSSYGSTSGFSAFSGHSSTSTYTQASSATPPTTPTPSVKPTRGGWKPAGAPPVSATTSQVPSAAASSLPPPTPQEEEEWKRRQREHARQQAEKFQRMQEAAEQERYSRSAKQLSKEDVVKIFDEHERRWSRISTLDLLTWYSFPWPILQRANSPEELTVQAIHAYVLSPHHPNEKNKSAKDLIKDYIKRWHPDRFETKYLPKVREDDREKVKEGAGVVARNLNELLTRQSSLHDFAT